MLTRYGVTLTLLIFVLALFVLNRLADVPRSVPLIQWFVLLVGLCSSRLLYMKPFARPRNAVDAESWRPILLVGSGDGAALMIHMLDTLRGSLPQRVVGILSPNATIGRTIGHVPILGRLEDANAVLTRLNVQGLRPHRIVLTAPPDEFETDGLAALELAAAADGIGIDNLSDILRVRGDPEDGAVMPSETAEFKAAIRRLEARSYTATKRLIDIAASATALTLLAPVLAVIALAVCLDIGQPVVFRQVRPGRRLRPFMLYKFCTMRDALGADGRILSDEERTSLVGRLLRRTRLDELLQLWNVLKGDMSFIGPRPLLERDLVHLPDHGFERCSLRPGITGWAQVHGGHQLGPAEKLALDLYYIRNFTLLLDLKIAGKTVRMMMLGEKVDANEIRRAQEELALS